MNSTHDQASLAVLEEVGLLGPLRREMSRCAGPDVHPGGAAALWHLAEHGPLRMSDLAAGLRVDVSVVSRQVGELVGSGHLARHPDPADGRACLLSVTALGRDVLDTALTRLSARFGPQLSDWETSDLLRLAGDLRRLGAALLPRAAGAPAPSAAAAVGGGAPQATALTAS